MDFSMNLSSSLSLPNHITERKSTDSLLNFNHNNSFTESSRVPLNNFNIPTTEVNVPETTLAMEYVSGAIGNGSGEKDSGDINVLHQKIDLKFTQNDVNEDKSIIFTKSKKYSCKDNSIDGKKSVARQNKSKASEKGYVESKFVIQLVKLFNNDGKTFQRIPIVGGTRLDLERLVIAVQSHGGPKQVSLYFNPVIFIDYLSIFFRGI